MTRILSILALALAFCSSTVLSAAEMPKVGDKAPAFKMKGSDGKEYAAEDFVGKQAVIIAWFPKAFTPGCTQECKSMKESGDLIKKFDVAYFTASTDTVEKNAEFAKSLDLDFPILCDPEGKNAQMFGVLPSGKSTTRRVTFIIGKDGKILAVEDKVQTSSHGEDLARQLDELKVDRKKK